MKFPLVSCALSLSVHVLLCILVEVGKEHFVEDCILAILESALS
jgi:hypothetical protein